MTEPHFAIRFDAEDRALLEACAKVERLKKADILRRALRDYAIKLGVAPEPKRKKSR